MEPAGDVIAEGSAEGAGVGAAVGAAVGNVEPWGTTVEPIEPKPGIVDTPVGMAGTVARGSRIGDGTSDGAIDLVGEANAWEASACHTGAGAEEARESVLAGMIPAMEPSRLRPCCMRPLGVGRDLAGEPQGGTCETTVGVGDPMRDATSQGGQPVSKSGDCERVHAPTSRKVPTNLGLPLRDGVLPHEGQATVVFPLFSAVFGPTSRCP